MALIEVEGMKASKFVEKYCDIAMWLSCLEDRSEHLEKMTRDPYLKPTDEAHIIIRCELKKTEQKVTESKAKLKAIEGAVEMVQTDKYRTLLYYRYIKYWSWEEITDLLSEGRKERYSAKNVMGYMKHRALDELQKVLDSHPEIVL